jgi:excisionase family DNA binding protein
MRLGMRITREDVLTVSDVAALLDLKPYTVKEYARRGILPGRKLGRTWRFLRPELEEAIRQLPRAEEEARDPHRRDLRSPL